MPIVAQPTAIVGTIHGTDENDVHPNQNNPTGIRIDSMQAKYRRPSGVFDILPKRMAIFSWYMLRIVARMAPTEIAGHIVSLLAYNEGIVRLTGKDITRLGNCELMVGFHNERNGGQLQVKDSPAEGYPERKEENNGFREQQVCINVSQGHQVYQTADLRKGR